MNTPPQPDEAFFLRVMRWQDGTLTAEETAELEEEMLASKEKRRVFAEWQVRSLQINELLRREAYAGGEKVVPPERRGSRLRFLRWPLAAAAALAVAYAAASYFHPEVASAGSPGLASVTYDAAAEWDGGKSPGSGRMSEGSYSLASGTVRMTLTHDGTVATLAGPARFDLVAPGHIRLHEGRLSAQVSRPDRGFTVFTDAATVLDRGTVFGVDVKADGEAQVSVLEGMVDVHPPGSREMTRIEQGGKLLAHPRRKQQVQPAADVVRGFEDLWPLTLGVDEVSHLIEFVVPQTRHRWNDYRSNTRLYLMPERQRVTTGSPLLLDVTPAGAADPKKLPAGGYPLAAGTRVSSFLLFFRPEENPLALPVDISGSITFSQPVLGVIAGGTRLIQSDDLLGHPRVVYRDKPRRGIEKGRKQEGRDIVRISRDGRRVFFSLHATADPDEFRVLVAAP